MQSISRVQEEFSIMIRSRRLYKAMLSEVFFSALESRYLTLNDRWNLAQALISTCLSPEDLTTIDRILLGVRRGWIVCDQDRPDSRPS